MTRAQKLKVDVAMAEIRLLCLSNEQLVRSIARRNSSAEINAHVWHSDSNLVISRIMLLTDDEKNDTARNAIILCSLQLSIEPRRRDWLWNMSPELPCRREWRKRSSRSTAYNSAYTCMCDKERALHTYCDPDAMCT